VSTQIIFSFSGHDALASNIAAKQNSTIGEYSLHQFPDGESYARVLCDCSGKEAIVVANMHKPNDKLLPLSFLCDAIRRQGASKITLIAPYLPYMRQDIQFNPGESITSRVFAKFVSSTVDKLITIDPHLHRYKSLDEIYTCETVTLSAMAAVAEWINANISNPLIIGPDSESEQWAKTTAENIHCDFLVLEKHRHGDRDVDIDMPDISRFSDHTPVLVDDIISTGRTMIETATHLQEMGLRRPVCIGVHGVFSEDDYQKLCAAYVEQVVTCDTVVHESNGIGMVDTLAQ
jgi:ribose-phosphate pyrophosphokinase